MTNLVVTKFGGSALGPDGITIPEIIMKTVGRRIANPAYPIMNVEVLSNNRENSITEMENVGAAHMIKLSLFLINGNEK